MKVILIFFTFMFSENKTERLNVTHVAPLHLKKKYIFMCLCGRFSGSPGSVSVDVCVFTFVRAALTAGWAFIKEL